jgi:hypothetical protein
MLITQWNQPGLERMLLGHSFQLSYGHFTGLCSFGDNMKVFQFRTNWRGQLILQRLNTYRNQFGDREHCWEDASTSDLKTYYEQLCNLQNPCASQELRGLFDAECG